jgi:hypothetical protein
MSVEEATFFGDAAGLRGPSAARFVQMKMVESPVLSIQAQRRLFEDITTPETIADIRRILEKPDVASTYGYISWSDLSGYAREVLFDLRYRGDYTPHTRERIQPLVVARDDEGLRSLMSDTTYWTPFKVPPDRIRARANIRLNENVMRKAS